MGESRVTKEKERDQLQLLNLTQSKAPVGGAVKNKKRQGKRKEEVPSEMLDGPKSRIRGIGSVEKKKSNVPGHGAWRKKKGGRWVSQQQGKKLKSACGKRGGKKWRRPQTASTKRRRAQRKESRGTGVKNRPVLQRAKRLEETGNKIKGG